MAGVYVSALEMFSIGIGPSSSHTVGPMRAGADFARELDALTAASPEARPDRIRCRLHGSLAATGIGHGTPDAVIAGLRGFAPESCDPADVHGQWARLAAGGSVAAAGVQLVRDDFDFEPFARQHGHPNALTLLAWQGEDLLCSITYLSVGGGFIERAGGLPQPAAATRAVSCYHTARELLEECGGDRSIADLALADEVALHGRDRAIAGLDAIWSAMRSCIDSGMSATGVLPGGLGVRRRAQAMATQVAGNGPAAHADDQLTLYALAVNEENAAGGRVVTAPTNGAAGVLPAVLNHHVVSTGASMAEVRAFLLTAAAIGSIVKANASISGAEAGCQGEVGSACAMAAAALCAVRGGSVAQVENAAEIAMEHHLGLTCDPVGGLVQIPCIERNAVAASTAQTAARIALLGDGTHVVSLDTVIETMRQTGQDMSSRYKETSEGGLAINVVEC
ncbi:L-serine ammonia-lyase [Herbiconiux sp.]|uniref:L-serine ammonia-lyase n=1 Tax=Herbiconiux sp. TaxID=1871186 RepID=UPI0025C4A996|nr:L-serine ammonia-lyase [Herbiconiux sp.]